MPAFRYLRATAFLLTCFFVPGCEPVLPLVDFDDWQFEGYQVYSHVPAEPVGIVFFFHGTYGSAEFATKVETVDVINELVSHGYAFVATESTLRTGNKRWDVHNPSLVSNPDLARLSRLHSRMTSSTPLTTATPIFGVGMSNGARMVTLFGQVFDNAGYSVAAIAPFMGTAAPSVRSTGGLRVPVVFVIAENDSTAPNSTVMMDHEMALANGTPSRLFIKQEEPLIDARFTRIPAINREQAVQIADIVLDTGAWNADGVRQVSVDEAVSRYSALNLPLGLRASRSEIRQQLSAILAEHQFVGLYKTHIREFFDAQLGP